MDLRWDLCRDLRRDSPRLFRRAVRRLFRRAVRRLFRRDASLGCMCYGTRTQQGLAPNRVAFAV